MDGNELGTVFEPQAIDIDGDGSIDGIMVAEDANGDGIADTLTVMADTDDNGLIDSVQTLIDTTGDGVPDTIVGAEAIDTTGDGIKDSTVVYQADAASGAIEHMEIHDTDESGFHDIFSHEQYAADIYSELEPAYEQFDPDNTDMDNVIGDPANDERVWEYQGDSGPCAIYAQAMAYQNVTGEEVDIEELIETATEEGWYNGGTATDDMDKVLNYLGLDADVEYRGDMEDIRECLENGGRVVAAVDGNEIWLGDNDTCYSPNDPNHAVEVIGIDYSGDEPMVIINDSGTPDGHAIMVPKDQFVDAWQDSDFAYVCVYPQSV